jgi:hypothetical protein
MLHYIRGYLGQDTLGPLANNKGESMLYHIPKYMTQDILGPMQKERLMNYQQEEMEYCLFRACLDMILQ